MMAFLYLTGIWYQSTRTVYI